MTIIETTVDTSTATVAKVPSKKSLAQAIFNDKLVERSHSLFASNKEFRTSVIQTIMANLGVTLASASTMYNAALKESGEVIGRDPRKEKEKTESGKRGRPAGSKNHTKEEQHVETEPVVVVEEPVMA